VLYQAWAFVAPGLVQAREEAGGAAADLEHPAVLHGRRIRLLRGVSRDAELFRRHDAHGVQMMTDMGSYLDFVMVLLLAFGLAFEVPVATVLLVWTGFVRLKTLKKNRGFVLLGIFIFAAFVTPPDAVSQSAMAVPMYFLYEIGIIMAGLCSRTKSRHAPKKKQNEAEREAGV
jgi:sec-independent protein translocase protein TatC